MESLLQNCKGVEEFPFPHISIQNALSEDYYAELYSTMPSWETVSENQEVGSGRRRNHPRNKVSQLSSTWKEFVDYHASTEFYLEWLSWFEPYFPSTLSERIKTAYGDPKELAVGEQLTVETFIGMNGPLKNAASVRDPHLDKPDHLANGLLYMADPTDTAGGDFQVYQVQGKPEFGPVLGEVKGGNVKFPSQEVGGTIPYEANRYGSFLATDKALHGVAIRQQTSLARQFFATSFVCTKNVVYERT